MKTFKILKDKRKGLEVLEAVITLPVMIAILLSVINLSLVVYGKQAVEDAAEYGARMGSVAQSAPAIYASAYAQKSINAKGVVQNPKVTILAASANAGSLLTVNVSGEIPNVIGEFIPGLPSPFKVNGQASFRKEGW
jgi:Flp pilus assembly protein TadG